MLEWSCGIPGKKGTDWEGAVFKLTLQFPPSYPTNAPKCQFRPPIFHPNVYPSGSVCLSIIGPDWKPSITVKQILLGIQDLLDNPNPKSPAQQDAYVLYSSNKEKYRERILEQTLNNKA